MSRKSLETLSMFTRSTWCGITLSSNSDSRQSRTLVNKGSLSPLKPMSISELLRCVPLARDPNRTNSAIQIGCHTKHQITHLVQVVIFYEAHVTSKTL